MPTQAEILEALQPVEDPEIHRSIVELDMVRGVDVAGDEVRVTVALTVAGCPLRAEITKRVTGEKITNRLISLWDPDARPIRKGKLGKPTEFGYVDQLCEITANTKTGARGNAWMRFQRNRLPRGCFPPCEPCSETNRRRRTLPRPPT